MSAAKELRDQFAQSGIIRVVGAHNPLGARIAERCGFDGVWSSGLEIFQRLMACPTPQS